MTYRILSFIGIPAFTAALVFTPAAFAQTTTTGPSGDSAPAGTTAAPPVSDNAAAAPSTATGNATRSADDLEQTMKDGARRAADGAKHVYRSAKAKVEDATLEARVITALHNNKETHEAVINVSSDQGVVTLSGNVSNKETADRAREIASQTVGVKEVRNDLLYGNAKESDAARTNETGSRATGGSAGAENNTGAN